MGCGKWGDVKKCSLSVIRWIRSGDLIHSMKTIVNNTLYIWKLLRLDLKCSQYTCIIMWSNRHVNCCGDYFRIYVYQITLNLHNIICKLYLNMAGVGEAIRRMECRGNAWFHERISVIFFFFFFRFLSWSSNGLRLLTINVDNGL